MPPWCCLLGQHSLERLAVIELQQVCIASASCHVLATEAEAGSENLVLVGNGASGPLLASLQPDLSAPSSNLPQRAMAEVSRLQDLCGGSSLAMVASASLAAQESMLLLALGLCDGTVLLLRHEKSPDWQLCGRHVVSSSGSMIVACGFASHGMFAVAADGARRLWLSGSACSAETANRRDAGGGDVGAPGGYPASGSDAETYPRVPPQPSSEPDQRGRRPLKSQERQGEGHTQGEKDTCRSAKAAEASGPSHAEIQALINQTIQEIAELESQEQFWSQTSEACEQLFVEAEEPPAELPPVVPPSPPKIPRLPRERAGDPKLVKNPRACTDSVDPAELSRAYLARACAPKARARQPFRLPTSTIASKLRNPWENSIESLSFNPLEHHIKSLAKLF